MVVTVPDDLLSNRLKALVVARDAISRDDLVSLCARQISAYMIPTEFELVELLPKTSTGQSTGRP